MEENRLKPMPEVYDVNLFNDIYKKTELLRKKLAWQIDGRRFGVDYKEILSWFDVKFLQVFRKYHDKMGPDLLKAHMIRSLQMFKQRILRSAYSNKAKLNNTVDVHETPGLRSDLEPEIDDKQTLLNLSLTYLKSKLSKEAYQILIVELNPPLYILDTLSEKRKSFTTKIPSKLIAEYLGWNDNKCLQRVSLCREEIRATILDTKEYFKTKDSQV